MSALLRRACIGFEQEGFGYGDNAQQRTDNGRPAMATLSDAALTRMHHSDCGHSDSARHRGISEKPRTVAHLRTAHADEQHGICA